MNPAKQRTRNKSISEVVRRHARLFNQRKFFHFHEVLEEAWKNTAASDRGFLQGLIQVAAAYVHFYRRNPKGALNVLRRGNSLLRKYSPTHAGLDLLELLRTTEELEATLEATGDFPKTVRFPKIRLAKEST